MAKKKADSGSAGKSGASSGGAAKKAPAKKAKAPAKKQNSEDDEVKKVRSKAPAKKAASPRSKRVSEKISKESSTERVWWHTRFSEFDISLFRSGKHYRLYEHFGAHPMEVEGTAGIYFAVWAPNAKYVSVIGNFNFWNAEEHPLFVRWDGSGIWEGFIPELPKGELYKYNIVSSEGERLEKADPFASFCEFRPRTGSITWDNGYSWRDSSWMANRQQSNSLQSPISVYEVHLGSWMRSPDDPEGFLSYRDLAAKLVPYVKDMGFTHVEFMPVMEHPFDGSWGYQVTGYFAPSSRFGTPQDFMYLVDELHAAGIGVYLDWVPAHFPGDAHGLYRFDGTHLYEHADPRKGFHPDWKSYIFNLGRNEVRSFMMSSAMYWLDVFHADGLRVDAVASMLYLDYSRNAGEWIPNERGGRENLENVSFFQELNEAVYREYPSVQMIAEESTSWPGVSRPVYTGGLGFGMKWMMGWMNDSLRYFERDPMYRQFHQDEITFSLVYAFTENFMLPLSHDEVVHGKQSLVYKMPGDDWQRFANLRLLYLWMFTHPGAKLLFMGCEFAQTSEWNHSVSLDWHLTQYAPHRGIQQLVRKLNKLYSHIPALYEKSYEGTGFEWIDMSDRASSVIVFMRKGINPEERVVVVMNMTPVPRDNYRIGLPFGGAWNEELNSDDIVFGGSGVTNGYVHAEHIGWQGREYSASLTLPPLGGCVLVPVK
jgi:1,4-alpha-glucan branching enzyme